LNTVSSSTFTVNDVKNVIIRVCQCSEFLVCTFLLEENVAREKTINSLNKS